MSAWSMEMFLGDPDDLASLVAVGARLMAIRNKQQLSQTQFAQALGISLRAYQTYESGQRSVPAEALQALNKEFKSDLNWVLLGVSSVKTGHALNLPKASVTENTLLRLDWLYEQMTALLGLKAFSVSVLAEAIGEETAERLEDVLAAKCAAPFKMLDAIADYCSANAAWLKHDLGSPFATEPLVSDYGAEFYNELSAGAILALHIIRANTDEGQVVIVKQQNERTFKIYPTTLHLSDKVGATGEAHQLQFKETCQKLCQGPIHSMGYILDADTFRDITHGTGHPLLALKGLRRSRWVSDWWDADYLSRGGTQQDYWPGFNRWAQALYKR